MSLQGLARGAALTLAARIATIAFGLLVLVVVGRLGPAVQGAFAIVVAVESALLALGAGGGLALARRLAHHGAAAGAPTRAWIVLTVVAGSLAGAALAVAAAWAPGPPYDRLAWLAAAAPLLLLVPTATGLWLGRGAMLPLNAPAVVAPALMLVGCGLAAASDTLDLVAVLTAWFAAKALTALGTGVAAWRAAGPAAPGELRRAFASGGAVRADLRFVLGVGLANVVSIANLRVALFFVERLQGLEAAGVYAVAVQVAELLWLLSSSLSVAAYRRIGEPDRPRAARTAAAAARSGVLACAIAAVPLALAASWAVPRVLGPAYRGFDGALALLLPGVVAYAAASALSAYYTHQLGRPAWAAGIAALSLLTSAAACVALVPRWGAPGAAAATSLGFMVAVAAGGWGFRRELRQAG